MQRVVTKKSLKNIKLLKVSKWALRRHLLYPQLIVGGKKQPTDGDREKGKENH